MKTLFVFILLGTLNTAQKTVYICNSKTSTAYHLKKDCRGLNACTHGITSVSEGDAKSMGLKLCGWED